MANPLAWLPFHGDKRSARAALLGGALTLSLCIHFGLPFLHFTAVEAVSETPVTVTLMPPPPMPLPEEPDFTEPVEAPDEENVEAPKINAPVQKPQQEQVKEEPPPEPDEPPEPAEPPPTPTNVKDPDAAARLAELQKKRDERMAERARRRAEREAKLAALKAQQGSGGKKGGAPPSDDYKTGKPDATYLCSANDKGVELHVIRTRPINEWVTIVPTVLTGFDTRPSLGGYLNTTQQVVLRDRTQGIRRVGMIEMSLPNDVMQIQLESPRGVRIAVGRLDARCLIGFKYASQLFPFTINRAPIRIIDGSNNTVAVLADVTFFKDASLEIHSVDGTDLPFQKGRLKNAKVIQANIEDHYEAARLAKSIADLFGIDLRPKAAQRPAGSTAPAAPPKKNVAVSKSKSAQD